MGATAVGIALAAGGVAIGWRTGSEPQRSAAEASASTVESDHILIGPVFAEFYACSQHPTGQLSELGDALGSDCWVLDVRDSKGRESFPRLYQTDGSTNDDWVGWRAVVLAPFDGTIQEVRGNDHVNAPGTLGASPAAAITFLRADGARVTLAHLQEVTVAAGDRVTAGQVVARVGNNGGTRSPHVHIGAWRNDTPLAVRFDLEALGRLLGYAEATR